MMEIVKDCITGATKLVEQNLNYDRYWLTLPWRLFVHTWATSMPLGILAYHIHRH